MMSISETNWTVDEDKNCIIRIEADQEMTREDIEMQIRATMRGLGFAIEEARE